MLLLLDVFESVGCKSLLSFPFSFLRTTQFQCELQFVYLSYCVCLCLCFEYTLFGVMLSVVVVYSKFLSHMITASPFFFHFNAFYVLLKQLCLYCEPLFLCVHTVPSGFFLRLINSVCHFFGSVPECLLSCLTIYKNPCIQAVTSVQAVGLSGPLFCSHLIPLYLLLLLLLL